MTYRPDIDGLRAIAVLGVILYHAKLGTPGGYVGVDVFFTISGFLITGIILKQLKKGTFSFLGFWKRRVKRLVPALFVVTIVTAGVGYLVLLPPHLMDLGGSLIAQPFTLSNVYFWRVVQDGYFGGPPEIRPLLHTWSLGVEEQFYLLYPLLLRLIWLHPKLQSRLPRVLAAITVASLMLCVLVTPIKSVAAFFNLPTRAWEFFLGGLILFLPPPRKSHLEALSGCGVLLITYSFFFFDDHTVFPGAAAIVPCLGTALLIWSQGEGHTTTRRFLSHPILVGTGLASYSLYLWHWPLIAYFGYVGVSRPVSVRLVLVLFSFLLGFLSYKYIEVPTRNKGLLSSRRSVLTLLVSYLVVCPSIGMLYIAKDGFKKNWSEEHFRNPEMRQDFRSFRRQVDPSSPNPELWEIGDTEKPEVDFLLWGDSHAMSIAPALDRLGREYHQKGLMLTRTETPPLFTWSYTTDESNMPTTEEMKAWSDLLISTVEKQHPRTIYLHAHWSAYFGQSFESDFKETMRNLDELGVDTCLIESVPHVEGTLERKPYLYDPLVDRWPTLEPALTTRLESKESFQGRNKRLFDVLKSLPRLQTIDLAGQILQWSKLNPDGLPLYQDIHHITDFGALRLKELFLPEFLKVRPREGTPEVYESLFQSSPGA